MSMLLFVGPTLSSADIEAHWSGADFTVYPPAKQGDIYQLSQQRPNAIGLIDGYFERVPAVWHKEILWAMDQGIHVFGAASMGALRAVELQPFGMEGVGEIFNAFQSGELEDDDEVTIIHSEKEDGYISYSEAMVNIRSTLRFARDKGIIDEVQRKALQDYAKQLHYSERNYANVLAGKKDNGEPLINDVKTQVKLKHFIDEHAINQKRNDALALLDRMAECQQHGYTSKQTNFVFQYTDNWQQMLDKLAQREDCSISKNSNNADLQAIMQKLQQDNLESQRVKPESQAINIGYQQIKDAARFRSMAIQESYRQGLTVTAPMLAQAKQRFCQQNYFIVNENIDLEAIQIWMQQQQLDIVQFDRLIQQEARFHWYCCLTQNTEQKDIMDYLKISGQYKMLIDADQNTTTEETER